MAVLALRVLQTLQFVPCRWRSHQRSTVPWRHGYYHRRQSGCRMTSRMTRGEWRHQLAALCADCGMRECRCVCWRQSDRVDSSHRVGGSGNDRASDSGSDSGMTSGSGSGRVVDRAGWERRVADVALSRTDRVTVSGWGCVQGLERRVVVWLTQRWGEVERNGFRSSVRCAHRVPLHHSVN